LKAQRKFTEKLLLFMVTFKSKLFLRLKKHVSGKTFEEDGEVQELMTWFKGQAADFYDSGIQKLVPRLNKCLDYASDYVEK
jgi:hypothetical protein